MSYVLILGAKSDIAKALAREYARNGYNLILAARKSHELEDFSKDIKIRYGKDSILKDFDITEFAKHKNFYEGLPYKPIGVILTVGYLGNQKKAQEDWKEAHKIINVNYVGAVSILNIIANDFEKRKEGFIIGISSVAGDRGRKTNYIYGSAKAGLSTYLSGLRNRLHKSGIQVLTVKPGFVATKMTEGMDLPEKLTATPEEVAKYIFKAHKKGKDIIYVKPIWRLIMTAIKIIPEKIFKKMEL